MFELELTATPYKKYEKGKWVTITPPLRSFSVKVDAINQLDETIKDLEGALYEEFFYNINKITLRNIETGETEDISYKVSDIWYNAQSDYYQALLAEDPYDTIAPRFCEEYIDEVCKSHAAAQRLDLHECYPYSERPIVL